MGLADGNRFSPGLFHFIKVIAASFDGDERQVFSGGVYRILIRVEEGVYFLRFAPEGMFGTGEVLVDSDGRTFTGRDGLDDARRPADPVPTGKDPLLRRLSGYRIGDQEAVCVGFRCRFRRRTLPWRAIGRRATRISSAGIVNTSPASSGASAPGAVELAQSHRTAADSSYLSAFDDDIDRSSQQLQLDTLVDGFLDFFLVGRHDLSTAAVDDG